MRPAEHARNIAKDVERWVRATKLDLTRLARWTHVIQTLRRLADDYDSMRRKYEHARYDLDQEQKIRRALETELENLKQTIIQQ